MPKKYCIILFWIVCLRAGCQKVLYYFILDCLPEGWMPKKYSIILFWIVCLRAGCQKSTVLFYSGLFA